MTKMTDQEKADYIALVLGDVEGGPYYPLFTPDQYAIFIKSAGGDVNRALVTAAISANFLVSGESSREVIGELSISSSTSANYLKLLQYLIDTVGKVPPSALIPWFPGIDDVNGGANKLLDFSRCDPCTILRTFRGGC